MDESIVKQTDISRIYRIKNIGIQQQRSVVIIDSTFKILDYNIIFKKIFEPNQLPNNFLDSVFLQGNKEKHAQLMSIVTNNFTGPIEVMLNGRSFVVIQSIALESNTFLLVIERSLKTQLIESELNFVNNINAIIMQEDGCFEGKMREICSEIDYLLHTYTTFTYLKKQEIVLIPSARFNIQGNREPRVLSEEERNYHQQLLTRRKMLEWSSLSQLAIHNETFLYAVQHHAASCRFIPVYSSNDEPIGYFVIYDVLARQGDVSDLDFYEKLSRIVKLIYKVEMHEQQIERLTYTDPSTNLPSYMQFLKMIKRYREERKNGVIKIIEPGEFSKIVELYGRPAGEELLKELGKRLKMVSSSENSDIARFTSSALIMYSPIEFQSIIKNKNSIIDHINEPFLIEGQLVYITLKAGIAPLEETSQCHDSIRFAESALTKSKVIHGTQTTYHLKRADQDIERELSILNHFKQAIRKNDITVYFQPKFELRRGRILSMEALARWISPELGFVSPAEFIPIAENAGLIRELELQIFEKVLKWQQQRQYEGKRSIPIAVNISPDHFYHPLFIPTLKELIQTYYADPSFIIIEITENMGLFDFERARAILYKLRALGISTSVDDFGIGYSSLSYLQKFSFNEIKIDQSFSQKIDELATQTIVKSIIQIAHMLDMIVVAEGVETLEQAIILKQLKCDVVQGYHYSRPLPIEEASNLLDEQRKNP